LDGIGRPEGEPMTLMNTEPAAASRARLWLNARGAASRSLLRAGIASAPASLLLVLICGLAYADAGVSLSVGVVPSGSRPTANFVANFTDVHQTIDGFGGADAFIGPGPIGENSVYDELYCVNATDPGCAAPGIGLTILRQGIGVSDQGNATAVTARGGEIYATQWGIDPNGNYTTEAQSIATWASGQISHGVKLYAVSTQNEPDCGCNGGSVWSEAQTAAFADALGPKLHSLSPRVNMAAPEVAFPDVSYNSYVAGIEADATANSLVDIFSFHQYRSPVSDVNDGTRHIWETETAECPGPPCPWNPSIQEGLGRATNIYDSIVTAGASAWLFWWIWQPDTTLGDQVLTTDAATPKRYFTIGNWSRFVRPGWVRIGVSGSLSGFYGVAAFKNPSTGAFAIVAINNSGSDIQNVTFGIQNATIRGSVTPYVTSGTAIGPLGSDGNLSIGSSSSGVPTSLSVIGGTFTSTVPYGVTTFVGQN
jgi:glucuronoarabinoxylan endo-1,4-beta-xylanase